MRTFILCLLLVATTAASANRMHVVIHARDKVVVLYTCVQMSGAVPERTVVRQLVRSPGHLTYRGVGGVPPYTLIEDRRDQDGNVCITLMDATGTMATGCGRISRKTYFEEIECPINVPEVEPAVDPAPIAGRKPRSASQQETDKPREPRGPRERKPEVERDRGTWHDREPRRPRVSNNGGSSGFPERPVRGVHQDRGNSGNTRTTTYPGSRPSNNNHGGTNRPGYPAGGGIQRW